MSQAHLRACPACARHVRVSEAACPFCRSQLDASFRASAAPKPPSARLTRAALFAFGTGTLALAPNCSSTPDQLETFEGGSSGPAYGGVSIPADSGAADTGPQTLLDAAYGAFALDAADAADTAPVVLMDAAYGIAPFDAEPVDDDGGDAGPVLLDAAYGAFPIDSGHD